MVIIDADVHISPLREGNRISDDELLRRMDRAGVQAALAWLQPAYFRDVQDGNRYVYEAMRRHPERIIGFGWVDPHFGLTKGLEEVKRCLEEYGFVGVKLNGAQNDFPIDDETVSLPLIEAIAKSGRLLAFHIGADSIENTHPFRLAKIARRFPETTILAVHMGGAAVPDLSRAMIEFAQECPNIYLIGSSIAPPAVLRAIQKLGARRVLFGSDTPFQLMHVEVAKYRALLEDLTSEEAALVLGGNAVRLFLDKGD
jgi:predicted TIM-barrel fold metal-dependent hydrolase